MCLHVCPPPRLLITSGVMWHDIDPIQLLNKFYSCYMAIVVVIGNGRGLGIDMHHSHQPTNTPFTLSRVTHNGY